MNKTMLITRHEFITTIRRRAFIVFTLAFPVLALVGMLGSQVISGLAKPTITIQTIGYVDEAGGFTNDTSQSSVNLINFSSQDEAKQALLSKSITEYFVIPRDYLLTGNIQRYTLNRELDTSGTSQQIIRDFLLSNLLRGKNTGEVIDRVKAPLNLFNTLLTGTGGVAPNQGGFATFIIPYIFSLLLLMSIFFSSGYLLQGLGEEKENRVMEILLSSVSSQQLLAGKVIGLGAAGLLQVIVWLFSARFLAQFASSSFGTIIGTLQVPTNFLIMGTVYFILGYLLFAVLMAGVGAISPTAREGQQMSTLFTITGVSPLFFMTFIIENPNHIISQALTIIPITAPITVMIRLGLIDIPIWQIAVSVMVLVASIYGCFILVTRLFRTYLLMYGKRPDLQEIIRSFRNA